MRVARATSFGGLSQTILGYVRNTWEPNPDTSIFQVDPTARPGFFLPNFNDLLDLHYLPRPMMPAYELDGLAGKHAFQ